MQKPSKKWTKSFNRDRFILSCIIEYFSLNNNYYPVVIRPVGEISSESNKSTTTAAKMIHLGAPFYYHFISLGFHTPANYNVSSKYKLCQPTWYLLIGRGSGRTGLDIFRCGSTWLPPNTECAAKCCFSLSFPSLSGSVSPFPLRYNTKVMNHNQSWWTPLPLQRRGIVGNCLRYIWTVIQHSSSIDINYM